MVVLHTYNFYFKIIYCNEFVIIYNYQFNSPFLQLFFAYPAPLGITLVREVIYDFPP